MRHELRQLRPGAGPERVPEGVVPGDYDCLCGSAIWLDVTAAVCIASDQILGHLGQTDPGVKIGRRY